MEIMWKSSNIDQRGSNVSESLKLRGMRRPIGRDFMYSTIEIAVFISKKKPGLE